MNTFNEVIAMFNQHMPELAMAFEMNEDFSRASSDQSHGIDWIKRVLASRKIQIRSFAANDPRWALLD